MTSRWRPGPAAARLWWSARRSGWSRSYVRRRATIPVPDPRSNSAIHDDPLRGPEDAVLVGDLGTQYVRGEIPVQVTGFAVPIHAVQTEPPDTFFLPGDSARYGAQYNKPWFSDLNHTRDAWNWNSCVEYPPLH